MQEIDFDKLELDEYEQDIVDNLENMKSVDNLEVEKDRLQQIAKYSIEKEEAIKALNEISKEKDFDIFVKVINERGLSIKDVLKEFIHKIAFEKSYNLKNG